jgi:hypothetical protein
VTITRSLVLLSILASTACTGKRADPAALPADPAGAVAAFLDAVKARDLAAMGGVWGSDRGPARDWMNADDLHKRLTVMHSILVHDRYAIQPGTLPGREAQERVVRVQIVRGRCMPVVPFTTREYRGRWIVSDIDLAAAGNPARACP